MFTLRWTSEAQRVYEELKAQVEKIQQNRKGKQKGKSSRQEGLFKQIHKTLSLLRDNPKHPGLQTHEFTSIAHPYKKGAKVFEAYVQHRTPGAHRIFWCYGPGDKEMTIIAITPHP
jgi:hypothetical protein